ncbi:MAG: hypothetical protein LBN39_07595 [Planctomycetaceae bacterium]|nr:hypothetical protein [Planctomycetaceae bacterium]
MRRTILITCLLPAILFSELIRKKEELLHRLLPVSQRQLEIVRSENVDKLLQHLWRKSKLLDELAEIERQLVPFKDIPPEQRVWQNGEERETVCAAIERCNELLEQILELDTVSTEEHAAQKSSTEDELKRVRTASQVHGAYSKQEKHTGKHFERNG